MEERKTPQQRSLTDKQLDVLKLLFRFRFGTSDHISKAQGGLSRQSANARLSALVDKELIVKKQDGRARLQGKPAVYSLAAKGRAILKKEPEKYSERVLNSIRANRDNSDRFITHNLTIFSIFNTLHGVYGDAITFLTKSNIDVDKFDYLPKTKPDAFIYLSDNGQYYFLYLLNDAVPDFALVRRVASIFEYEKGGRWENESGQDMPVVLLVCSSRRIETVMRRRFSKLVSDTNSSIKFASTHTQNIVDNNSQKIWRLIDNDEEVALSDL